MASHPRRRWSLVAVPLLLAGLGGNASATASELEEDDFIDTSQYPFPIFTADVDTGHSLSCAGM